MPYSTAYPRKRERENWFANPRSEGTLTRGKRDAIDHLRQGPELAVTAAGPTVFGAVLYLLDAYEKHLSESVSGQWQREINGIHMAASEIEQIAIRSGIGILPVADDAPPVDGDADLDLFAELDAAAEAESRPRATKWNRRKSNRASNWRRRRG